MPFIDLNTTKFLFDKDGYDVTIIGAGASGIFLAVNLTKAGKKVLVIESGHFEIDDEKQKLNEVINTGKVLTNAVWGRKRAIGGTTLAWGGQSLPFSAIDFNKRDWVHNSGWPIAFNEIQPFYKEANSFMEIDTLNYTDEIFNKIKISPPAINSKLLNYHVAKWANEPNFQKLYKNFLESNVTVVYNAHVIKISRHQNGDVEGIVIANFNENIFFHNVRKLIIASGTIEAVRLLMTNQIGNSEEGWLGKCFMDHPCIEIGKVNMNNNYRFQKLFNTHVWKGRKYSIRLSTSEEYQKSAKILNCSASIMFVLPDDRFDPYSEVKFFTNDLNFKRLFKLKSSIGSLLKSCQAYFIDKFYFKDHATNRLVLMIEQEPLKDSCIKLSPQLDSFGVPKAVINWDISKKTWDTVLKVTESLKYEMERLEIGKVVPHFHISSSNIKWKEDLSDVNHHMGGCRMSKVAGEGVVNTNLQVWEIPNLYVCSCAVFPTSSHSNPTLTLLALAARLNSHLKTEAFN